MIRPVRLLRLTVFVHESRLEPFLRAVDSSACVHVDEPTLVEAARFDTSEARTELSRASAELEDRGLEEPEPVYGRDTGFDSDAGDEEVVEAVEALKGHLNVYEAASSLGRTESVYVMEGWVPRDRAGDMEEVEEAVDGLCGWSLDKPELEGVPPTLLDNPGFFSVPELLVRTYGLPSYFEIDPTVIIGVTFPLLFGLMYGDLGHALLLLSLALASDRMERAPEGSREFLFSLGLSSAFFGALYGEVFGLHYFEALWFDRIEEVLFLIQISVVVGLLHVVLGMLLAAANSWLNRRIYRVLYRLPWVAFYLLWIPALFGEFYVFTPIALVLVVVAGAGFAVSLIEGKGPYIGFLEAFRRLFDSVMHVSSYVRIAAVSLTHVVFSDLLLKVLEPGGSAAFGAWLLLTLLLIVFVETFFASLQALRLHWTEWFYNFYEGEGREFVPLDLDEVRG